LSDTGSRVSAALKKYEVKKRGACARGKEGFRVRMDLNPKTGLVGFWSEEKKEDATFGRETPRVHIPQ